MDDEPATDILNATYRALCEHGYADLTLQDIAAEADTSKASIHYHYDTKDELFVAFLEYLYDRYTATVTAAEGDTEREQLRSLLELLLADDEETPGKDFRTAMLEVKAQAPYDETVQDRLTEADAFLVERLHDIVASGVEAGEFDERIDPSLVAEFLTTTITGAHTRQVAVDCSTDRLYEATIRYVETHLVAPGTPEGGR